MEDHISTRIKVNGYGNLSLAGTHFGDKYTIIVSATSEGHVDLSVIDTDGDLAIASLTPDQGRALRDYLNQKIGG